MTIHSAGKISKRSNFLGKRVMSKQMKKLIEDTLFFFIWLAFFVLICFKQADTLKKFRAEQNKMNYTDVYVNPGC